MLPHGDTPATTRQRWAAAHHDEMEKPGQALRGFSAARLEVPYWSSWRLCGSRPAAAPSPNRAGSGSREAAPGPPATWRHMVAAGP